MNASTRLAELLRGVYLKSEISSMINDYFQAQVELNKKRDAEVTKLRKDVEEANIQREATTTGMKKKQQDAVMEMNEQCDQLTKMKTK